MIPTDTFGALLVSSLLALLLFAILLWLGCRMLWIDGAMCR